MSKNEKKIEFYKRRTWSQSMMIGIDFYQQHLKIIYGNVFKIGLPIAFIVAIFGGTGANQWDFTDTSFSVHMIVYYLLAFAGYSILFVVVSYLLKFYQEGLVKEPGKFKLMNNLASYFAKVFVIFVLVGILFFFLGWAYIDAVALENMYLVFLLIGIIIFLIPLCTFIVYPILFEDSDLLNAFSKGIKMGFKTWVSTFIMNILMFIIMTALLYFFIFFGLIFAGILSLVGNNVMLPITAFFGFLSVCLIIPIPVICFAFYYFSIREANEGVSLKAKIDDFENL